MKPTATILYVSVRQRWTFRRWWERSRAVVEESTGVEKTKRHHHHSSLQYVQIGDYVPAASAEL